MSTSDPTSYSADRDSENNQLEASMQQAGASHSLKDDTEKSADIQALQQRIEALKRNGELADPNLQTQLQDLETKLAEQEKEDQEKKKKEEAKRDTGSNAAAHAGEKEREATPQAEETPAEGKKLKTVTKPLEESLEKNREEIREAKLGAAEGIIGLVEQHSQLIAGQKALGDTNFKNIYDGAVGDALKNQENHLARLEAVEKSQESLEKYIAEHGLTEEKQNDIAKKQEERRETKNKPIEEIDLSNLFKTDEEKAQEQAKHPEQAKKQEHSQEAEYHVDLFASAETIEVRQNKTGRVVEIDQTGTTTEKAQVAPVTQQAEERTQAPETSAEKAKDIRAAMEEQKVSSTQTASTAYSPGYAPSATPAPAQGHGQGQAAASARG